MDEVSPHSGQHGRETKVAAEATMRDYAAEYETAKVQLATTNRNWVDDSEEGDEKRIPE